MTPSEDKKLDTILYKFKAQATGYGSDEAKRDIYTIINHNYQATENRWLALATFIAVCAAVVGYAVGHAIVHLNK